MIETLTSNGFEYCGYCNCSGTKNYKYSKGDYIIYVLPKKKVYHIKHNGTYVLKNQSEITLCSQLKSLSLLV